MSMGRHEDQQTAMWLSGPELARSPGHRFYEKLNELLSEAGFDPRVGALRAGLRGGQQAGSPVDRAGGVKLSVDGFGSVPHGQTAWKIAKALTRAIDQTAPPLPAELRRKLIKLNKYRCAIRERNQLLHSHPCTAADGSQQLWSGSGGPPDRVDEASALFEDAARFGNEIFHGPLAAARPSGAA